MKLIALLVILLFLSCKKEVTPAIEKDNLQLTRSDNASVPLKCHTLSLSTLKVVKQLYTDTRVKSLTLETEPFLGINFKWFLYFAYYPNQARIRGSRGEYSLGTRRTINRDTIEVNFNSYGYATTVYTISASRVRKLQLTLTYNTSNPSLVRLTKMNNTPVINDAKGNITSIKPKIDYGVTYTYNVNAGSGKRHFYAPATEPVYSMFVLGDYFALLELMQWIPMPRNARTSVSTYPNYVGEEPAYTIPFSNHKYDARGNLVQYAMFGPDFLENITWHCNP